MLASGWLLGALGTAYGLYVLGLIGNIVYLLAQLDETWTLSAKIKSSVFCFATGALLFAPIWPVTSEQRRWLYNNNTNGSRYFYAQCFDLVRKHIPSQQFVTMQSAAFPTGASGISEFRNAMSTHWHKRLQQMDTDFFDKLMPVLQKQQRQKTTLDMLSEYQVRSVTGLASNEKFDYQKEIHPFSRNWTMLWSRMSNFGHDFIFKRDLTAMIRYMSVIPWMYSFLNGINFTRKKAIRVLTRMCTKSLELAMEMEPDREWNEQEKESMMYIIASEYVAAPMSSPNVLYAMLTYLEQFRDRLENEPGFVKRFVYESVRCSFNSNPVSRSIGWIMCMAQSEQSFENEHVFNPDRYTNEAISNSTVWGAGSRSCPAQSFVRLWYEKVVKYWLDNFNVEVTTYVDLADARDLKKFPLSANQNEFKFIKKGKKVEC